MNDLLAAEAVLRQLAEKMKCSKPQAARAIRRLDNERRGHVAPTTGKARDREITALVNAAGFTVREFVKRKLPLLSLPDDLEDLVRRGALQPTKALILARLEDETERAALTRRVLLERLSVRALETLLKGGKPLPGARGDRGDAEARWVERQISRSLGIRAELLDGRLVLHFESDEVLATLLERLEIEL